MLQLRPIVTTILLAVLLALLLGGPMFEQRQQTALDSLYREAERQVDVAVAQADAYIRTADSSANARERLYAVRQFLFTQRVIVRNKLPAARNGELDRRLTMALLRCDRRLAALNTPPTHAVGHPAREWAPAIETTSPLASDDPSALFPTQ